MLKHPHLPPNKILVIFGAALLCILVIAMVVLMQGSNTSPHTTAVVKPPVPSSPAIASPSASTDPSTLILELFNPSDLHLTKQQSESTVMQQIEQVMTTSYVLKKCGFLSDNEYKDSFRALIVHAQQTKLAWDAISAEARVRIAAESAGASYSLLYSRTKCDSAQLPDLTRQLITWQKTMLGE